MQARAGAQQQRPAGQRRQRSREHEADQRHQADAAGGAQQGCRGQLLVQALGGQQRGDRADAEAGDDEVDGRIGKAEVAPQVQGGEGHQDLVEQAAGDESHRPEQQRTAGERFGQRLAPGPCRSLDLPVLVRELAPPEERGLRPGQQAAERERAAPAGAAQRQQRQQHGCREVSGGAAQCPAREPALGPCRVGVDQGGLGERHSGSGERPEQQQRQKEPAVAGRRSGGEAGDTEAEQAAADEPAPGEAIGEEEERRLDEQGEQPERGE